MTTAPSMPNTKRWTRTASKLDSIDKNGLRDGKVDRKRSIGSNKGGDRIQTPIPDFYVRGD